MIQLNDIYYTIQCEGALSGTPMVIVRLQGCAVGCHFCDTKETWSTVNSDIRGFIAGEWEGTNALWTEIEPGAIADYIALRWPVAEWVMLTGGEPAQQDLSPLIEALHEAGFNVQLETSGTALYPQGIDFVCVSPKIGNPGGLPILDDAIWPADELKFVVGKAADLDIVETFVDRYTPFMGRVSLQPMSTNEKATELCVKAAKLNGWAVSIQLHKIINIR